MKKGFKSIISAFALLLCLSFLASCGGGKDITLIAKEDSAKYLCIYEAGNDTAKNGAMSFKNELTANGLKCVSTVFGHTAETGNYEILFGKTDREASIIAWELLQSNVSNDDNAFHWVFCYKDGKLAIIANDELAYEPAIDDFFDKYMTDKGIVIKDNLKEHVKMTYEEYDEFFKESAADKKAEHAEDAEELLALLETQRDYLAGFKGTWSKYDPVSASNPEINLFGVYTEDMVAAADKAWGSPDAYPTKDQHPRLLVTEDSLPLIRRQIKENSALNDKFNYWVEKVIPNDCILPEPEYQGEHGTVGGAMEYNLNENYLTIIQAKALAYLIYGDEYYGYQAILYMKNYLMSLDIKQIPSDQTRRYGYTMRAAALVYDWCYDLLTETDKIQLIAGVENCLCRGRNAGNKSKMEVGFPPSQQGAIEGHACEFQILRDYLSFAVAIYDENSSWYEYIAGRVYNQFVPFRDYYYAATGVVHQGTGYAIGRHSSDLYSAWILQVATGENPYSDALSDAAWGIFNYEIYPGYIFSEGDGTGDFAEAAEGYYVAYLNAYLYQDSDMLAMADYLYSISPKDNTFGVSYNQLNIVAYIALRGLGDLEASDNRYGSMNLIQYNASPLGQYVVRNSWGDESAAAVFMKIKERSTGGHEHLDVGTFEIYYKGMLTSDGGCYDNDNAAHTMYYHDATISHNGLIIYNPGLSHTEEGYYTGGQTRDYGPGGSLNDWLGNTDMDKAELLGHQHAYLDDAETQPLYAYIAGDITKAYDSETVDYVGRRMLTVYTGDEEFPMVFFVFDDIASKSISFEKRFLLQISSKDEPTVSGKTVTTENGGGRLVLTCLSSNISINPAGGRTYGSTGKYVCASSKNYLVNGVQLVPFHGGGDDGHWGRIEIVSTARATDVTFMNVLYVTDKGNDDSVEIRKVSSASGVEGAVFNDKIAAIFAADRNGATEELSCRALGDDELSYYISGVAAGEWKVTVDGKECGTYTATEEGGLLTFRAPSGSVVITPVN